MNYRAKTVIIVIFLLMAIFGFGIFLSQPTYNLKQIEKQNTAPDWYMTGVTISKYNALGAIKGIMTSTKLTHDQKQNIIYMQKPFFILYDKNRTPWHISSLHGKNYQDEKSKTDLWGNVRVKEMPGKDSHHTDMSTTQLTYYPQRNFAHTDKPVTIKEPGSIMHSIGVNANLKTGVIHFLSKTTGEYSKTKASGVSKKPAISKPTTPSLPGQMSR